MNAFSVMHALHAYHKNASQKLGQNVYDRRLIADYLKRIDNMITVLDTTTYFYNHLIEKKIIQNA